MRLRGSPRQEGFTLVEMLVTLVILGMTALLVAVGLGGARRAWERVDTRLQNIEATEGAEDVLRRRMEGLWPSTRYEGSNAYVDFVGESGSVTFLAPPGDAMPPGALRRYSLGLAADGSLVLSNASDLGGTKQYDEVLLRGVQSLELSYFGASPAGYPAGWRGEWLNQQTPPLLIRVQVRFPPGDRRWWPDLIVHPVANVDTDCLLDKPGGGCKER